MSKPNAAQKLAADLAALAKAATPGPWVTDGDHVNEHGYVLYSYVASGRRSGGRIAGAFANCLVKTDEQCRANAAFIAAANPKAVLVLIAENDRLRDLAQTEIDNASESAKEVAGARMTLYALEQETDRLKAENETLRKIISDSATSCGAAVSVDCSLDFMGDLPNEISSVITKLRRDAERYRWLRRVDSDYAICTPGQDWGDMIESHLDAQVDASIAASGREQRHG